MDNRPEINPQSNLSFSFSRNQSKTQYEPCYGWDLLKRAIVKVAWSPIVFFEAKRSTENFAFSDFLALDFDDGATMQEIAENFRDSTFLIGTTKNHMCDKSGVIAERFRLVVPWERRITNRDEYVASVSYYIKKYSSDEQCKDAARLFFPCREITYFQDFSPDLESANVTSAPEPPKHYEPKYDAITGNRIMPRNVFMFLTVGDFFGGGRNISCFITAKELRDGGLKQSEAIAVINKSPFDRTGFPDREIETAVRSAYKGK